MTHMTPEDFLEVQNKMRIGQESDEFWGLDEPDKGPESALQSKIKAHCKGKGWPILSFPRTPKVKRFLPAGWPDDMLILPFGIVLFLEDKTKTGRVSPEQKLMKNMFRYLGHTIYEVRSLKKFLEIIEGVMKRE